jgi:DNA-binding transcriptional regulator YhcF (GntR family)
MDPRAIFDPVSDDGTAAGLLHAPGLYDWLRRRLLSALHLGHLRPGDRLPSIRELKQRFELSHHAAVQLYERLAAEGLVEKRERSGIYVADPVPRGCEPLAETGSWVAALLAEACEHHIRVPMLPELIRRWTSAVRVRCACIESDEDHRHALCREFSWQFGAECTPVPVEALDLARDGVPLRAEALPEAVRKADVLISTTFHAPSLRPLSAALGKPLVTAIAEPQVVSTIAGALRSAPVTLVCADARFGERMAMLREGSAKAHGLRVVLARDAEALARLDRHEPILLTRAARAEAGRLDVRLLTPDFPKFSLDSARAFASLLVQLNVEAERHRFLDPATAPAGLDRRALA